MSARRSRRPTRASTGCSRPSISGRWREVWAHGEHVRCVHPGWGLLTGWDAVRQSWEAIFKHSEEMRFSITDINAYVEGVFGWVTCTENILSETRGKISVTSVLATNNFERSAGEWRMNHHHASHILTGNPSTGA